MKNLLKWLYIIGVTLSISGCLEVTPNTETLILEAGQTQIFTAKSNIMNAEVVWTLDGYEVAKGNEYVFVAIGDCAAEKNQTLTVTEQGGSTLIFHETATWAIQIPALSCLPSCYLDEDGDGFGDINKPVVNSDDPPSNCIQDATDCDDSNPKIHPGALEIIDGFDNNCNGEIDETLLLYVYSNGWGNLLEIIEMEEEGPIMVNVEEEDPYSDDIPSYFIYAMRSGYFTEYYYCDYGDTIEVDLDPIDPEKFNGTLFINIFLLSPFPLL